MKDETATVKLIKSGPANDTTFILGTQGSGKTTLIANMALTKSRFVIFDTKGDFPIEFFPRSVAVRNSSDLLFELNKGTERIIVQLWEASDPSESFDSCCDVIFRWQQLNDQIETWFILDELNKFVFVNDCPKSFEDICLRGRSVNIHKVFGAQWFNTVPAWMRDGFSKIIVFRHTDERGLEKLEAFGFNPDEVKSLPPFVCLRQLKGEVTRIKLTPQKA